MPSILPRRFPALRTARVAALLSAALLATACDEDDDPLLGEDEPEIEAVRLTITPAAGTPVVYTVTNNGATPSPVQLRVGTSTILAAPLDADGQVIDESSEFELRMDGLPGGVTFTRNGTLSGPVTATAATAANVTVSATMWHRTENHGDYTANFPLRVVQ